MPDDVQRRLDLRRVAPDAYRALAALTRAGGLDDDLRELVKLRASQLNGCGYCQGHHRDLAIKDGWDPARVDALPAWRNAEGFTDRERAALALTEAMTILGDGSGAAAAMEEAAQVFDQDELARLLVAITAINAWNRVAITTVVGATAPDGGAGAVPSTPDGGAGAVPPASDGGAGAGPSPPDGGAA